MMPRRESGMPMEISCLKDGGRESATYVANQRSSSEKKRGNRQWNMRPGSAVTPCSVWMGAGRFDGHRNLAALQAELVHKIGARLGHFHFECSARQLRVHGEAAFAAVTARAVSLGPRKVVLVTRSRR